MEYSNIWQLLGPKYAGFNNSNSFYEASESWVLFNLQICEKHVFAAIYC